MEMVMLAVTVALLLPSSYSYSGGKLELGLPCGFKIFEYLLMKLLAARSNTAPKKEEPPRPSKFTDS